MLEDSHEILLHNLFVGFVLMNVVSILNVTLQMSPFYFLKYETNFFWRYCQSAEKLKTAGFTPAIGGQPLDSFTQVSMWFALPTSPAQQWIILFFSLYLPNIEPQSSYSIFDIATWASGSLNTTASKYSELSWTTASGVGHLFYYCGAPSIASSPN